MTKMLIIKRDKIGDLVLTLPIFELVKSHRPDIELHLLANTYNGWVVENNPHIGKLWLYPRVREGGRISLKALIVQLWQITQLRRERFDWIVVAGGSASKRANYRARQIAGSATRIVAYCDSGQDAGISDQHVAPADGHEVERMAALFAPLGIQVASPLKLSPSLFRPRAAWLDSASAFLAAQGLRAGQYVMLGVGARRRARQPMAAQVLRWAGLLHERFGLHTVFTWTPGKRDDPLYPGDDDIAAAVLLDCPSWLHPYRGAFGTVVGLTWLAKTSVYPDSGLMHVAAACPGDVIGLFADPVNSSSPAIWGPIGAKSCVVVAPQSIAEIPDEAILKAVAENLNLPR